MKKSINKMIKIEQLINELKKEGCNVFCVDNSQLVLELPNTIKKNEKKLEIEKKRNNRDREINGAYAGHFSPDLTYDYEINLH